MARVFKVKICYKIDSFQLSIAQLLTDDRAPFSVQLCRSHNAKIALKKMLLTFQVEPFTHPAPQLL